jgi:hypothetical protein
MATRVLLDEIHVEVLVPRSLANRDLAAVRRALQARSFLPKLRRALGPVFAAHPALAAVRVRVAR